MNFFILIQITFYLLLPLAALLICLIANLLGIAVMLLRKTQLIHIGPHTMYTSLFFKDSIIVVKILVILIAAALDINVPVLSDITCKLYRYVSLIVNTATPMMMFYISLERIISIKFPSKSCILRRTSHQFIYISVIILFNSLFYLPCLVYYRVQNYQEFLFNRGLIPLNSSSSLNNSNTLICESTSIESNYFLISMTFLYMIIVGSILLVTSTFILICIVVKRRTSNDSTNLDNIREVEFSLSPIIFNVCYMVLVWPVYLIKMLPNYYLHTFYVFLFSYLLYLSYGVNFFILYFTNSSFKKEYSLMSITR